MTSAAADAAEAAPSEGVAPGRREIKAARTRAAIETAALKLFDEHGFEATTVEQIAAAADIAPRTFFRYFPSKDAVLFGDMLGEVERMRQVLRGRPASEHPMRSLTVAMLDAADRMEAEREHHLRRARLLHAVDATGQYEFHLLRQRWMQDVTDVMAEHLDTDPTADPRPGAWSMTLVSCFGSAMHAWLARTDGTSLRTILTDVLAGTAEGMAESADEARQRHRT